ncbi:MAG: beta-lactamase family protein [Bacteroidales bacterium]|nr:beta-lactamase family protein [Bacteroidales bacterium]
MIGKILLVAALVTQMPDQVGHDTKGGFERCDSVINKAIEDGNAPGAVLCVVQGDSIVYEKAYGNKRVYPKTEPMTEETVFDLASLSKCVGTTIAAMQLVEQGLLGLDDYVDEYLPGFAPWTDSTGTVSKRITVRQLMTHTSGLAPVANVLELGRRHADNRPEKLRAYIIKELDRRAEPGTGLMYSCPNFITLQYIIESLTGERLCDYAQTHIFDALGLQHTCYFPTNRRIPKATLATIAPTEVIWRRTTDPQQFGRPTRWRKALLGQVHDPTARRFNCGNSGNAGVFSNAEDLAVICAAIMNGGEYRGRRILRPETVELMCTEQEGAFGRALGWDASSGAAWIEGETFAADHTVCHTGYTGTSIVIDLDRKIAVILLANRVHPADEGGLGRTRAAVSQIVAESLKND